MAAQASLSADDQRELETHLRDSFAELKSRGLNAEEAFWVARRRVGQPQQLAEEFVKADPTNVWRERIFWMWLSVFLLGALSKIFNSLGLLLIPVVYGTSSSITMTRELMGVILFALPSLVFLIFSIFLNNGKLVPQVNKLISILGDRRRFAVAAILLNVLASGVCAISNSVFASRIAQSNTPYFIASFATTFCSSLVVCMILVLFMPVNQQKSEKRA